MDLRLFWAVAKRYKRLSIVGTLLAVILAVFAYGTPGPGGITPRGSVTWESQAQLLITQGSGPYGRADPKAVQVGAPGYMSSLSPIYAQLANGTAVQNAIRNSKIPGVVAATEGVDPNTGAYIPFVNLTATAPTEADAEALSRAAITSFQAYVNQSEAATAVPGSARVSLEVVKSGLPPVIASEPKPTVPILVFLAIISGTIMLMFSLENRDPRSAIALGRLPTVRQPAALLHRDPAHGDISSITPLPPGHSASAANGDRGGTGVSETGERPLAVDRLLKRR